ncbi:hypothetical protein H5410_002000, partial [Solanum commersonii]
MGFTYFQNKITRPSPPFNPNFTENPHYSPIFTVIFFPPLRSYRLFTLTSITRSQSIDSPSLQLIFITLRPGKKVTTSSHRKRVWRGDVPPALAVPRDRARQFGVKVVTKEGKVWYKKHTEASYFSNVCIDRDMSLVWEFPQILRRKRELRMDFIFAKLEESHFVTVRGVNVPITPAGMNDILGTPKDKDPLGLTGLNIRSPYQSIRHTLCGP